MIPGWTWLTTFAYAWTNENRPQSLQISRAKINLLPRASLRFLLTAFNRARTLSTLAAAINPPYCRPPAVRTGGQLSADRPVRFLQTARMALLCGFRADHPVGTLLAIYHSKASLLHPRRTAMKFETLLLNSFFFACVAICVSTLGAMLV
ncbi:hypothetical protein ACFFJT_07145 [Dyella flava]|uniref:Uncharacterized protein n=1 Tax=Dyella flava TaxID=1920170 RepID=A0ABS2K827_9GAMM|nr:hypothetical protein [Dyella flava]MBM7127365.1 hypothetical protein [Dyella flava]GLQ50962.1 hypothetical protein GCM10010872_24110 [Dyella flava]